MSGITNDIWILGAAGRSGRAIAVELAKKGLLMTFVGRNGETLKQTAEDLNIEVGIVTAGTIEDIAAAILRGKPRIVINTIGPFARTAIAIVSACPPGSSVRMTSRRVVKGINKCAPYSCKKTIGVI